MALDNARRPFPCSVDNPREGATKNECVLPIKGITYSDDEFRVCGSRCIALAMQDPEGMSAKEEDLVRLIARHEFGDAPTDKTIEEMTRGIVD